MKVSDDGKIITVTSCFTTEYLIKDKICCFSKVDYTSGYQPDEDFLIVFQMEKCEKEIGFRTERDRNEAIRLIIEILK